MTTLVGNVTAYSTLWTTSSLIHGDVLAVESELVKVKARFPAGVRPDSVITPNRIRVQRGVGGTSAASHSNGTSLVPHYEPFIESGGMQVVSLSETVIAFDDDLVSGVELVAVSGSQTVISLAVFEETAVTATADDYKLALFVDGVETTAAFALNGGVPVDAKQGLGIIPGYAGPIRDAVLTIKVSSTSSGTWTAGSILCSLLMTEHA
jgi:hypothetical protein